MRKSVYSSAVVAAFLGSVAVATAAELNLTAQQKQSVMQSVQSEKGQPAAGFQPRVGTAVPQSMFMHQLPSSGTPQVPATKDLENINLAKNKVLWIDPKEKRASQAITPA